MATQVQFRRGTTSEHGSFTGAVGEITVDTDKDTAVVHDGTAAGGRPLLREDLSNLANGSVTYAKIQDVSATDRLLGRSSAGAGDVEEITCTAAGRALIDDADAAAQRTTLGLVIGTNVQAYDADTAKTDVAQSFTAAQRGAVATLTPAATVTANFSVGNNFSLALNQNTTLANPSNITAGQSGVITITQDSTARTLAYGSYWYFEGGVPTLGTTAGAVSALVYYVDSATHITAKLISEPTNA